MGDGGSGGDPMNHAQNPQSLLGKMLRIDVGVPDDDSRGYRVPEDNPFIDGDPVSRAAGNLGFWTAQSLALQFRRLDAGRHVRARDWRRRTERARGDQLRARAAHGGRNYGWRLREGRSAYDQRLPAAFRST